MQEACLTDIQECGTLSLPMQQKRLAEILREMRADSLIREAETIRDYQPCPERNAQAEKHIREAMLLGALRTISPDVEHRIFTVLNFVMPGDAPFVGEMPPDDLR